jgi:hypothetical protein
VTPEQSPDALSRSGHVRLGESTPSRWRERKALKSSQKEALKQRQEAEAFLELTMDAAMHLANVRAAEVLKDVPKVDLRAPDSVEPLCVCSGPKALDEVPSRLSSSLRVVSQMAGRSVSTYPLLADGKTRVGSPICDTYYGELHKDEVAVLCICDGCGWGFKSREAATRANNAFVEHATRGMRDATDSQALAALLLRAVGEAHCKIVDGKNENRMAGTTTLLGGVVLPIRSSLKLYHFVFASAGDCKAYWWKRSTGKVVDLCVGSRGDLNDPKDPGGRIGPHTRAGLPDLRNLQLGACVCDPGDLLILMTDGVADNLDPEFSGVTPEECGVLETGDWDAVSPATRAVAKSMWGCRKMAELFGAAVKEVGDLTPEAVVYSLLKFCTELTKRSREFLEASPYGRIPEDFLQYPGKLDHTSALCYACGDL